MRFKAHNSAPREVFVRRISWSATLDDVRKLFERFGTVEQLRMPAKRSDKHHDGIAFIVFSEVDSAQAALSLDGESLKGMALQVKPSGHRKETSGHASQSSELSTSADAAMRTVMRGNVPDVVREGQSNARAEDLGNGKALHIRADNGEVLVGAPHEKQVRHAALPQEVHELAGTTMSVDQAVVPEEDAQLLRPTLSSYLQPSTIGRRKKPRLSAPAKRTSQGADAGAEFRTTPAAQKNGIDKSTKDQDFFRSLLDG